MNTPMPLVTIAIPTYNRAGSYLPQALASAVSQTYSNIEIVVSDNCSTDTTPQVIESQKDDRIRYFRQNTAITPNENFNFCLEQARGEYLLLLLDDETIDFDFVATCVEAVQYHANVGLIRTGLRVIDANGEKIHEVINHAQGLALADFFLAWFRGRTAIYLCNTLFNTRLLRSTGGLHSRHNLFQDVIAQVKVAAISERVDIKKVLASTRSHPGQFTYSAKVYQWSEDALDLLQLMTVVAPEESNRIRQNGMRFFARICYSRAGMIRSPWARLRAYRAVYRMFECSCLPSARLMFASTDIYRRLRNLKRLLKGQPTWAAAG